MTQKENSGGSISSLLNRLYHDVKQPSSYSSAIRLYKAAKKEDPTIKFVDVKKWLTKQYAYSVHKKTRYKFPRRMVVNQRIDMYWSADLIQVDGLSSYNAGYNFIATVIDNFSRKAWARSLKQKTVKETEAAMRSIIEENDGKSPFKLWTDLGTEWVGLKKFYEEFEIERYSTKSPLKAVVVERFNQTLENWLYKAMTARNTTRWIGLLQDVVDSYNNRISSVLHGLTPNQAHLKENEEFLRQKFQEEREKYKMKFRNEKTLRVGEHVRIIKDRNLFSRGYESSFDREIRTIEKILPTIPKTYKVSGKQRSFYIHELSKADEAETPLEKNYFIERTRVIGGKLLRTGKKSGGETQYLLKARNVPDLSTWISQTEFEKLKDGNYLDGIH